jgi:DNA-binding transcriptional regulator/RsmH inhibitor MraZ
MITICKIKIDNRGRLNLPDSFLKANKIKKNSFVTVHPVGGRTDAVRLEFEWEKKNETDR